MNEFNEKADNNVIDAKERIKFKDVGEFYCLGSPEDWKDLVKYSKFYLADENEDRRGMVYNLLRPVLLRRFKEVCPENFAEIISKIALLTDSEKIELKAFIRDRETIFAAAENQKEVA